MQVTCRLEFDAGHRIPDEKHQCCNLHGHRYVLEVCVAGEVRCAEGESDHAMVWGFSDIKQLVRTQIVEVWDHAFLVWDQDTVVLDFLRSMPGHKTVVFALPPTVETLAQVAFDLLDAAFKQECAMRNLSFELARIRLYETPNAWADVSR